MLSADEIAVKFDEKLQTHNSILKSTIDYRFEGVQINKVYLNML